MPEIGPAGNRSPITYRWKHNEFGVLCLIRVIIYFSDTVSRAHCVLRAAVYFILNLFTKLLSLSTPRHDDVIKWKHFPRYWPFVWGIHRSPVNSPHKGQWRGALIFSLICVSINGWVNNREAGALRRYRAHYDVSVMSIRFPLFIPTQCLSHHGPIYAFDYTEKAIRDFIILLLCTKS